MTAYRHGGGTKRLPVARPLDIRAELEQSVPVGFASFQTIAELRNIRVRGLTPAEIAASGKPATADDANPSDKP